MKLTLEKRKNSLNFISEKNSKNVSILGKNAVNIGQHYFHNEDLSEAKIHIMKIMLTDIHGIIIIMS